MIDIIEQYEKLNKHENELYKKGYFNILGIDEVGRGPLAGDVVIAGVILDPNVPIYNLNDSKKLTENKRNTLSEEIIKKAKCYSIVSVPVNIIIEKGINYAIIYGVNKIIENISFQVNIDFILIDYMKIDLELEHLILKKGDSISNSIAAASIIAKVYRDRKMIELKDKYPNYLFEKHKGYGTKKHIEAIKEYGIIKGLHRENFEPIKSFLKEGNYE